MKKILSFFLLGFILYGCSYKERIATQTPIVPYPIITYQSISSSSIIPQDLIQTFENRFKILFNQNPNNNITQIEYFFTNFYNESQGDFAPNTSFSMIARYIFTLHIKIFSTNNATRILKKDYEFPVASFNPLYDTHFDTFILESLK
ncbi:hypothetical protein [Helicobacter mesocricetorum]|uniref:hypothetical protein n=1 Tax=Helicobacter mesocricetorum TaxID=87012 RepID=UPI000CF07B5A|nr:hypothetical protein [Helicobacter mesocricetorum]